MNLRILIVDDSPFVCRLLAAHLQSEPGFEVVGTALSGARALDLARTLRPDAMTLDLGLPDMNGLVVLDRLMHECPLPVLMVSGVSRHAASATLEALRRGAVDFVLKYTAGTDTSAEALRREIVTKVRLAARVQVIRSLGSGGASPATSREALARPAVLPVGSALPIPVVVIGASTGGPLAVRELLEELPPDCPFSVVVVQHMPAGFTRVLAAQLNRQVRLPVKEADDGDHLARGAVLVAPGEHHLLFRGAGRVEVLRGPKVRGHCPSIDVTMQSAAETLGHRAAGVVLTGMGSDGANGLTAIRARGGRTFAQDAATCVVNGMPQQAIDRGAVDRVAPPAEIGRFLRHALIHGLENKG